MRNKNSLILIVLLCGLGIDLFATLKVVQATSLRGDFNNDGIVNLHDVNLFLPALTTRNARFALAGSDADYIDLYDFNELIKVLGTTNPSPSPTLIPVPSHSPTPTNTPSPSPSPAPTPTSPLSNKSTTLACTKLPQPNQAKMLNVGTWNIGDGTDLDTVNDAKATQVGKKFHEYSLDVMIVQEVHIFRNTAYSDPITHTNFMQRVQSVVPVKLYFYAQYQENVKHSLVTISKFPIADSGFVNIDGGRKVSYVLLTTPAGPLKVFNTHLTRTGSNDKQYQCNSLRKAIEFIWSKTKVGDNYILGGDFNMEYENGNTFQDGTNNCSGIFHEAFQGSCSGQPCNYLRFGSGAGDGVIDFIFGGKGGNPRVHQYCHLDNWGMIDAHPMYAGTIQLP